MIGKVWKELDLNDKEMGHGTNATLSPKFVDST